MHYWPKRDGFVLDRLIDLLEKHLTHPKMQFYYHSFSPLPEIEKNISNFFILKEQKIIITTFNT